MYNVPGSYLPLYNQLYPDEETFTCSVCHNTFDAERNMPIECADCGRQCCKDCVFDCRYRTDDGKVCGRMVCESCGIQCADLDDDICCRNHADECADCGAGFTDRALDDGLCAACALKQEHPIDGRLVTA